MKATSPALSVPRQFHLAQIVLTVKPGATAQEEEAVHKKAIELRAQAARPKADFAELARNNSQEPQSAEKGGDVGWLREPDMIPPVRDASRAWPRTRISQPVHVPDGWHILKLLEIEAGGPGPVAGCEAADRAGAAPGPGATDDAGLPG